MPSLVDDVNKVLCAQGEEGCVLHPKTVQFIENCQTAATALYGEERPIASRQARAIVAASAIEFDGLVKEIEAIKSDVHGIRESIRKE
jgi:hypothetical protein